MTAEEEKHTLQALLSIAESLDWFKRLAFNACSAYNASLDGQPQKITPPLLDYHYPVPLPQKMQHR